MSDSPPIPDPRFEEALALVRDAQILEAAKVYKVIVRERPDDFHAHYKLGALFLEVGTYDLAIPHLKAAFEGNPRRSAWVKYLDALIATRRPWDCRRVLDEGLQRWGGADDNTLSLYTQSCAIQQLSAKDPTKPVPLPEIDDPVFYDVLARAWPYSMSSIYGFVESFYALYRSVVYAVRRGIPGSFVECGAYMGGMSLMAALTFMKHGDTSRDLFLLDTFEGMPAPTIEDGDGMARSYAKSAKPDQPWAKADIETVHQIMLSSGYPPQKIHMVKGKVEDTIPANAPENIAILRLDTDLYDSYKHTLIHLYPRLAQGGALILDDYGGMPGARKAVDEYFSSHAAPILLNRVNFTLYTGIKA